MTIKDVTNRKELLNYVESVGYKTQGGRIPLDFYKKEINLVSFAVNALGYEIDSSKVGRNHENQRWFYLKREGVTNAAMEDSLHANSKILVARRHENPASPNFKYNEHYYFSQELAQAGDKKNHGSIIDLVGMHYNADYSSSLRIVDNFLIHNRKLKENFNQVHIKPSEVNMESEAKRLGQYHSIRPLEDSSFLNQRGISNETINDKRFSSVINNSLSEDGRHLNTAFPIHGTQGLIGFEIRNHNFKGVMDQKNDGFWRSCLDHSQKCESVILTESAIDALSHAQINGDKSNSLYLSTAGNITSRQVELLQTILDKGTAVKGVLTKELDPRLYGDVVLTKDQKDHNGKVVMDKDDKAVTISYVGYNKPHKLVLGFDNDQAGKMLTVKTLGKLNVSEFFTRQENKALKDSEITVYSNKTTNSGRVNWQMKGDDEKQIKEALTKVAECFNLKNKQFIGKLDEKAPFELTFDKNQVDIRFKNQNKQWDLVTDAVKEIKFLNSPKLEIDRPITKDYNQDLKGYLGIDTVAEKKIELYQLSRKIEQVSKVDKIEVNTTNTKQQGMKI